MLSFMGISGIYLFSEPKYICVADHSIEVMFAINDWCAIINDFIVF